MSIDGDGERGRGRERHEGRVGVDSVSGLCVGLSDQGCEVHVWEDYTI